MTNHDEFTTCRLEDKIVNRNNWQDKRITKQCLMVFDWSWSLAAGMFLDLVINAWVQSGKGERQNVMITDFMIWRAGNTQGLKQHYGGNSTVCAKWGTPGASRRQLLAWTRDRRVFFFVLLLVRYACAICFANIVWGEKHGQTKINKYLFEFFFCHCLSHSGVVFIYFATAKLPHEHTVWSVWFWN